MSLSETQLNHRESDQESLQNNHWISASRPGFEGDFYEQFIPELLASYNLVGGLNNRDAHNMPSTRAVGQICEGLLQLLFPGFHDDDAVHHGSLAELTRERLAKVRSEE